jgi:hypothetical protein
VYSSTDIIRGIKSRRQMGKSCSTNGESGSAYCVLVVKLEGGRPHRRPRRKWEDNIRLDLCEV